MGIWSYSKLPSSPNEAQKLLFQTTKLLFGIYSRQSKRKWKKWLKGPKVRMKYHLIVRALIGSGGFDLQIMVNMEMNILFAREAL